MKVLGTCFPNDIWYSARSHSTEWLGQGIWAVRDLLKLANKSDVEMVTDLSESNWTHPILQTVIDQRVDLVPLEVGMTSQRFEFMDFTNIVTNAEIYVISKKITERKIKNFLMEIFDWPSFLCILISFFLLTFVIWFGDFLNRFKKDYEDRNQIKKHSFSSVLTYSFGAAFNQGFPATMRLGTQATTLAAFFTVTAMIISTIFSGLVIVKLLKKDIPDHINTLKDLKNHPDLKIIVVPSSYIDDLIESVSTFQEFRDRVEYQNINVANFTSLKLMSDKIQAGTHVMMDDKSNFKKYTKSLELRGVIKSDIFHFSKVIFRHPGAWILPKNNDKEMKELINVNLQWLIDLGHYSYYKDAIDSRLFKQLGNINQWNFTFGSKFCRGRPFDRREVQLMLLRPTKKDLAGIIGQPKLSILHLKHVFIWLLFGYAISFGSFIFEILCKKCEQCHMQNNP